jgi:hypothetical protein
MRRSSKYAHAYGYCRVIIMTRHLHLNLFIQSRGHHEASWRHPKSSKLPLTDIRYTVEMAQKAEAGLFDLSCRRSGLVE